MANSHQNRLTLYHGNALFEGDNSPSEQRLWRAVLNQALEDAFGVNTIHICARDKEEVDNFFKTRTAEFDSLCDDAGLDPTRLWRKVQRLKGVQCGFLTPLKKEKGTLEIFETFKQRREKYKQSHWRNAYVG
jgi:hypothetical protein